MPVLDFCNIYISYIYCNKFIVTLMSRQNMPCGSFCITPFWNGNLLYMSSLVATWKEDAFFAIKILDADQFRFWRLCCKDVHLGQCFCWYLLGITVYLVWKASQDLRSVNTLLWHGNDSELGSLLVYVVWKCVTLILTFLRIIQTNRDNSDHWFYFHIGFWCVNLHSDSVC